ncbi:MAG: FecR domain-containing protein [Bacteroidota bacterium]
MSLEKYKGYTVEDFMADPDFQEWVFSPSISNSRRWLELMNTHTDKKLEVKEAKQFLLELHGHFDQQIQEVTPQQAKDSYNILAQRLENSPRGVLSRRRLIQWSAAASIALVLGLVSLYFFQIESLPAMVYQTGNGERESLQLPDGTRVQLNANSQLTFYPDQWEETDTREVWLSGEGYFTVTQKASGAKFVVHAGEVDVQVLGTQFNVRSRGDIAEVVLEEGKVELAVQEQKIAMVPGDLVSYSKRDQELETKKVKTSDYSAWKDGIMVFNSSLSEVTEELQDLFDIPFEIQTENLKSRHIQLHAKADSLEQVLEILELLYPEEITVKQEGQRVIIY